MLPFDKYYNSLILEETLEDSLKNKREIIDRIINSNSVKEAEEHLLQLGPWYCYYYASNFLHGRFKLGEPIIAKDYRYAYSYAASVLDGERVDIIEKSIATNHIWAFEYAEKVLNGKFELGEPAISKSAEHSYLYADYVLYGRFELGEPAIATDAEWSLKYAKYVLEDRFELGEDVIYSKGYTKNEYEYHLDLVSTRKMHERRD